MLKFFLPDAGQVKENQRFPKTVRFRGNPAQQGTLNGIGTLAGCFLEGFSGSMIWIS